MIESDLPSKNDKAG